MTFLKRLLVSALISGSCLAGPTTPDSINFVSGSPLNSFEGPTGGFGDVAANVLAALEFKTSYPSAVVRLIVTSLETRRSREVPTTNEILTTMIPSLKPSRLYRPQIYRGVEFIFTEAKYSAVAQLQSSIGYQRSPVPDLTEQDLAYLRKKLPQAQLAIQLSANANPAQMLRALAPIAISVGEFRAAINPVEGWLPPDSKTVGASAQILLSSGAQTLGFYLVPPKPIEEHRKALKKLLRVSINENILFAYSHSDKVGQLYIDALALALKDDPRNFLLFVRNPNRLKLRHLPKNIRVAQADGIPHEGLEALIACSSYSPLLSGDVSQSLGISYATGAKSLVIEVPPWAQDHIETFKYILGEGKSESYQQFLDSICLDDEQIAPLARASEKWKEKVVTLAQALTNREANEQLVGTFAQRKKSWNLYHHLLGVYTLLTRMDFSFLQNPNFELLNFAVLNQTTTSPARPIAGLKKVASEGSTQDQRRLALWLLLNQGVPLDAALWKSAAHSLIDFESPYFNPWTLLPRKTPRAKLASLNSAVNQRFLKGELSYFVFWRAKISLPAEVIQQEKEVIDYLSAFKAYASAPTRIVRHVHTPKGTAPQRVDALEQSAIREQLLDIDPDLFYAARPSWSKRKPSLADSLHILKTHNHDPRAPRRLSNDSQYHLLRVIQSVHRDWRNRPGHPDAEDALPEAVAALKDFPPNPIGLALIEEVIRIKSIYGDSKTTACELAATYYRSQPVVGKKKLQNLLGICLVETAEEHPSYRKLIELFQDKLPGDLQLWNALVHVMNGEAVSDAWAAERIATLLASLAGEEASLIEPLVPNLLQASEIKSKGFPRQAEKLIRSFKRNPCLAALLESSQ